MIYRIVIILVSILNSPISYSWEIDKQYLKKQIKYSLPNNKQLSQAESAFNILFSKKQASSQAFTKAYEDLRNLGFDVSSPTIGISLIATAPEKNLGFGLYLINHEAKNQILLQTPHQFHDRKTGKISLGLFKNSDVKALCINQVPRYANPHSDFAHHTENFFIPFTKAFLSQTEQKPTIIQLHGYAQEKRKTPSGKNSDVIISNSTIYPTQHLTSIKQCLSQNFKWRTKIFPEDVNELGGTKNTIFRSIRGKKNSNFVHLELNADIRSYLAKNTEKLGHLADCLHSPFVTVNQTKR